MYQGSSGNVFAAFENFVVPGTALCVPNSKTASMNILWPLPLRVTAFKLESLLCIVHGW